MLETGAVTTPDRNRTRKSCSSNGSWQEGYLCLVNLVTFGALRPTVGLVSAAGKKGRREEGREGEGYGEGEEEREKEKERREPERSVNQP